MKLRLTMEVEYSAALFQDTAYLIRNLELVAEEAHNNGMLTQNANCEVVSGTHSVGDAEWSKTAEEVVNDIDLAVGVGWDTDSTLSLLSGFIQQNCCQKDFEDYCLRVAQEDVAACR